MNVILIRMITVFVTSSMHFFETSILMSLSRDSSPKSGSPQSLPQGEAEPHA